MSEENRTPEAVVRARALGHFVESDPPAALSAVRRWTCTRCGDAALEREGVVYGSATTRRCPFVSVMP